MRIRSTVLLTSFILSLGLAGCGGDDTSTGGTPGTYTGAITFDDGTDGSMEITLPEDLARRNPRAVEQLPLTGQCIYADGSADLDGGIDPDTGDFELTGGGYTFTGTFDFESGTFTGSLTGDKTGSFSGVDDSNGDVKVYCGTWETDADNGLWILVVSGDTASGSYDGTQYQGTLTGTRSGNSISVQSNDGGGAEGTISGNSVSGDVLDENGVDEGDFTGSTSACST